LDDPVKSTFQLSDDSRHFHRNGRYFGARIFVAFAVRATPQATGGKHGGPVKSAGANRLKSCGTGRLKKSGG
jgi:hypothetical protein